MEDTNYLAHHGVKGQRWGERKYQYENGSLTPEGRRHYGVGEGGIRAQIKMIRRTARENRRIERVENAERIRDEKQKRRLESKLETAMNADKVKAERQSINAQKRQLAALKMRHPMQYRRLKKYMNKDGTLNDEGKALYFNNGKKKTLTNMSNQDLKNATYRTQLKNKYNEQVSNYNAHDPKAKIKSTAGKVLGTGAIAFAASLAFKSASDALSNGKESVDLRENGKAAAVAAISAMGMTLTRVLNLQSHKGNKAYNAFEAMKKKDDSDDGDDKPKSKAKEQFDQFTEEMGKRSRVHKNNKTTPTASTKTIRTSTVTPYARARSSYGNIRTSINLTANSSAAYRQRERAINTILNDRGSTAFSSMMHNERVRDIGARIVESRTDIPVTEIAGYLTERHS